LFRHVHPLNPPGKTLLQFVDPETALRIDVFRAFGETMRRTSAVKLAGGTLRLIALEDLLARSARLALDLATGVSIPAKYAADFLRLAEINPCGMEIAWQDQRKPDAGLRQVHEPPCVYFGKSRGSAASAGLLVRKKNNYKRKAEICTESLDKARKGSVRDELNRHIHSQYRLFSNSFQQHFQLSKFFFRQ
jgi:hypothetical protein